MKKTYWSVMLLLAVIPALAEPLTVNVVSEGPGEGLIDILVFRTKKGFPNKPGKAFHRAIFPAAREGPTTCVITNLPYGTYSLSVLHDLNANGKADKKLGLGPPKEPIGFSNIPEKMRRQPAFESTLFSFSAQSNETAVALWYVF